MGPGGCGSDQPIGGQADTFLDFLLNEVKILCQRLTAQTEIALKIENNRNCIVQRCTKRYTVLCWAGFQVMEVISTVAGDRALTDQQHLGITGCSMGGLFSCYAGNKILILF